MAKNVANVMLPKKESLAIIERVRTRLVEELKGGKSREVANAIVAEWLGSEGNILSPYADYVVDRLIIPQEEIDMRVKYGDDFTEAFIGVMNAMNKHNAA